MIRRWLSLLVAQAVLRALTRLAGLLVLAGAAIAAAPASVVAAGAFGTAWLRGWPPRRLLVAAAWCGPMVTVWLVATARTSPGWVSVGMAPYHAWLAFWRLARAGTYPRAAVTVAPAAIPLGLAVGAAAWSQRTRSLRSGAGGLSPASAVAFDQRQWRHQARAARARIAAPGSVPLTMRGDLLVVGAVIRAVGHRAGTLAAIGYGRMRSHQVVIGTTGTGKTTLLLRLWTGFMAAGLRRHVAGLGPAPLLVVLDCKGGSDARRVADRFRRVLREAGARSVAVWPDEASLSLWSLPPRQLTTTLVDLIEHGTGSAAYYADVMEALVALAVEAPCGPPVSASDLLTRLEPGWLSMAYAAAGTSADHALIRSAGRHLGDVALRFRTLFRRLGTGLDGPGEFGDADAWYCILEGTDQISVAEGQARAIVDLLANVAARGPSRREILLAVDEFSAVSRRLPIWQLYERARSLGRAVQVSAQSWEGLAATQDERQRIAASSEGGIWLLRTPHPEPVIALAGTRKEIETTRRLGRFGVWPHEGSSRLHDVPVADPGLIRDLDTGQVAYLYRGGVTYIQVKRLVAAPAAVTGAADRENSAPQAAPQAAPTAGDMGGDGVAGPWPAGRPDPVRTALPDAAAVLDAAFGAERPS
ncbi:MAG TPA: hypothetical protein VF834_25455 [Streptosporangiaceae bacterium]